MPVYGVSQDENALKILQECFPEKEIIGINCRVLIEQHGSLHCITMQYTESVKLNKEILAGNISAQSEILLDSFNDKFVFRNK